MNTQKTLNKKRALRANRTRSRIFGTAQKPRLAIFRSNRGLYAQLIDDEKRHTLIGMSTRSLQGGDKKKKKSEQAAILGELMGKKIAEIGVKKAVFDRRSYKFHGRIRSFVEGVKKSGVKI